MSSSQSEVGVAAVDVRVTELELEIDLADGRRVAVPVSWYPRLEAGAVSERANWQLIAGGAGIRWPDLDEDISVEGVLAGHRSGESVASLERWRAGRSHAG